MPDYSMAIKVGLMGCGAIGTVIARYLDTDKNFELAYLLDNETERCESLSKELKSHPACVIRVQDMEGVGLIIEAASQDCVRERVPSALEKTDVMIMSVGAFADDELFRQIKAKAEKHSRKVYIPSGAIAGLDGLKAAAQAGLSSITLTTRKPVKAFENAPWIIKNDIALHSIRKPTVIFDGNAKDAAEWFPQNVNVAVTLSLAGIGAGQTKVKIIADPFTETNQHEIAAEGKFGTMTVKLDNKPLPNNRKTSQLAALSAIATLKKISETVQIGT
jgi:aspartate dehydrogenase